MTRPEEPTEALPTRALPADPGATVDLGRGGGPAHHADATVHLGPASRPAPPLNPDATVHLGAPTVGGPGSAEPTVHFGVTPEATVHLGVTPEATVHLGATPESTARFDTPTAAASYTVGPTGHR
ncbi:hypothetical protein ACWEH1_34575, partial [Micromonospora chersina]